MTTATADRVTTLFPSTSPATCEQAPDRQARPFPDDRLPVDLLTLRWRSDAGEQDMLRASRTVFSDLVVPQTWYTYCAAFEVIARVPHGDSTLAGDEPAPSDPPPVPDETKLHPDDRFPLTLTFHTSLDDGRLGPRMVRQSKEVVVEDGRPHTEYSFRCPASGREILVTVPHRPPAASKTARAS